LLRKSIILLIMVLPFAAWSQGIPMVNVTGVGKDTQYSLSLQLLALMTTITLLPSLLLMMTSFIRIIIVLSILRQALGTGQTPPNTVLVGLSLFLTLFIMSPVLTDVYQNAIVPYLQQGMGFDKALAAAEGPIRGFMVRQTREDDIALFMQMANKVDVASSESVPFTTLVPAFITSELKSAFTIGFLIYIPFDCLQPSNQYQQYRMFFPKYLSPDWLLLSDLYNLVRKFQLPKWIKQEVLAALR
jgi:flagellar biosynthetic protein FliP